MDQSLAFGLAPFPDIRPVSRRGIESRLDLVHETGWGSILRGFVVVGACHDLVLSPAVPRQPYACLHPRVCREATPCQHFRRICETGPSPTYAPCPKHVTLNLCVTCLSLRPLHSSSPRT